MFNIAQCLKQCSKGVNNTAETVSWMGIRQRHWLSAYYGAMEVSFLHLLPFTPCQWDIPGDCRLKIRESTCFLLTVWLWKRQFIFWYLKGKWDTSLHFMEGSRTEWKKGVMFWVMLGAILLCNIKHYTHMSDRWSGLWQDDKAEDYGTWGSLL